PANLPPAGPGLPELPPATDSYGCQGNLKVMQCPSAPAPDETVTALLTISYGTPQVDCPPPAPLGHLFARHPGRLVLGRGNYLGVAGDWRVGGRYRGLLSYNSRTTLARVPDGTGNTLLFAEYAGGYHHWNGAGDRPSGWSTGSWASGPNYVSFGLCPNPSN